MSISASTALFSSTGVDEIKKLTMFNKPNIEINSYLEHESTYHIKGTVKDAQRIAPFEAYVTKDYKEVIFGKGFEASTEKPLLIPLDTALMKRTAAYSVGDGEDEYFIFTDPECPYCKSLEKSIPMLSKNAKFHIFLYPLSFHKEAKAMSYHIMSKKNNKEKAEAMHGVANNSLEYKDAKVSQNDIVKFDADLKAQMDIANSLGVTGTPSIFDGNGNKIEFPQLLQKYNIAEPVDLEGINFLRESNLEIVLNNDAQSKKPLLYIFMTPGQTDALKDANIKYGKEKSIRVFLKLDKEFKYFNHLKAIYMQQDNTARVKLIKDLMSEKEIDNTLVDAAKNLSKDEETKFLPVSYVMQKMRLKSNSDFVVVDSQGNVVE